MLRNKVSDDPTVWATENQQKRERSWQIMPHPLVLPSSCPSHLPLSGGSCSGTSAHFLSSNNPPQRCLLGRPQAKCGARFPALAIVVAACRGGDCLAPILPLDLKHHEDKDSDRMTLRFPSAPRTGTRETRVYWMSGWVDTARGTYRRAQQMSIKQPPTPSRELTSSVSWAERLLRSADSGSGLASASPKPI